MLSFAQLVGGALLVYISLGILAVLSIIWSTRNTRAAYRPQSSPIPPPPPRFFFVYAGNPDEAVGSPPALPSNYQWPREFGESAGTIDFCAVCGQPAELTCSRCRSVFYCSRKHKKQRLRQHKRECFPFKFVKAILLPVDENQPRIIEVVCNMKPPEDGEDGYDHPQVRSYLGHPDHLGRRQVDPDPGLPGLHRDYSLEMFCRDAFLIDGSPVNQCVQHLTWGLAPHKWAGPIVILKQHQNTERYVDADLSMLEPIIVYFLEYGRGR